MKTKRIAKQLLKGMQLPPTDLARLALETIESLGDMAQNRPRLELISILHRTLNEGVAALKAATQTGLSLRLMLYGGHRPAEVSRLDERDFNWDDGQVIVRPTTSKTGGGRAVPLRDTKWRAD